MRFSVLLLASLFPVFATAKPAEVTYGLTKPEPRANELFMAGHLLTPAVSTLPAGKWAAGTIALGYGITDRFMIATSPWLISYYNLNNLIIRYRAPIDMDRFWGTQIAYFKDNPSFGKTYKMEAYGFWGLYRYRVNAAYRVVASLNYFYFKDSTIPFSLKRWDLSNISNPSQFTISTLNEVGITKTLRLFVEFGFLGVNYSTPNYHFGTSLAYRWDDGYMQLGLSGTGYISNMTKSAYNQIFNQTVNNPAATMDFDSVYRNSVAIHPEVQLQWQF